MDIRVFYSCCHGYQRLIHDAMYRFVGHDIAAQLLMEHGAFKLRRNKNGKTPSDCGNELIRQILSRRGWEPVDFVVETVNQESEGFKALLNDPVSYK